MTSHFRLDAICSVVAVIAGLIHLGAYLGLWWTMPETASGLYWRVGLTVVLIIVIMIAVTIMIGIANRDAPERDEREYIIGLKAMRAAFYAYSGGVTYVFLDAFDDNSPMDTAHMMIAVLLLAEIVRLVTLTYYLRKGA